MFSLLKRCKYSLYSDTMLHYGSTNPMIRMYILMLDTRNEVEWSFLMKQTKMYVCTLKIFILVDVVTLLYKLELN